MAVEEPTRGFTTDPNGHNSMNSNEAGLAVGDEKAEDKAAWKQVSTDGSATAPTAEWASNPIRYEYHGDEGDVGADVAVREISAGAGECA